MMDIGTTEILVNVNIFPRDPGINFPGNGKLQSFEFLVPTFREETLIAIEQGITKTKAVITTTTGLLFFY